MVKNLPAMQQTWVWSLGQEDTLEMEMVTHSRIIAWEIPWTEESGRLQSMVLQRVEKDWVTNTFTFTVLIVLLLLFSHSALSNTFQTYALHTPGFPVLHHFLELAQTHVHWVGDAIQPSHPLLSPSHPAQNLSQHQGLFQWVSSSHQVAKVLELQFQHESFSEYSGLISFRIDWSELLVAQGILKSLLQHHSSKASFFGAQLSLWFNSHIHAWLLEKPQLWPDRPLAAKLCLCFLICCLDWS